MKILNKIKKWFKETSVPFLKKSWMQIINIVVLFVAYGSLTENQIAEGVIGLWLFVLLSYYIFWKFFGAEKMFKK